MELCATHPIWLRRSSQLFSFYQLSIPAPEPPVGNYNAPFG
jgi:hypothetical protein